MGVECRTTAESASEELARAAQAGDRRALNTLLAHHQHEAYRVALRLVGRTHDAEEVLQNALERVLRHLGRYDPSRPFRPWLMGIVVNQARSYWRLAKLRSLVFGTRDERVAKRTPDGDLLRKELRDALTEALARLPLDQREVFVLKHVEGLSFEDIATITGDSTGALRVRTHRARKAILDWCRANSVTFASEREYPR